MYLCVILRKGDTIGVDDSTLHPSAPMSASASRPYGTLKMGHTDSYFRRGLSNAVLMNTKNFIRDGLYIKVSTKLCCCRFDALLRLCGRSRRPCSGVYVFANLVLYCIYCTDSFVHHYLVLSSLL